MNALIICMHACNKIHGKTAEGSREREKVTNSLSRDLAPLVFGRDIMLLWHRNDHGVPRAGSSYCTHHAKTAVPGNDLSWSRCCPCAS